MPHRRFTGDEIAQRGEQLYELQLRKQVEIEDNIGKIIAIDIESSDYAIGSDVIGAGQLLFARHPNAVTWTKKIGYDAVYSFGGTLLRTCP